MLLRKVPAHPALMVFFLLYQAKFVPGHIAEWLHRSNYFGSWWLFTLVLSDLTTQDKCKHSVC